MLDVERILAPIDSTSPAGRDLRLEIGDTTFDSLEERRREVAPEDDYDEGRGKEADWEAIVRDAGQALATRSKDLELAARLAEALVRTEGFQGLRVGLRVPKELLIRYWNELHPGVQEGELDLELRAKPLRWLNSALALNPTTGRGVFPALKLVPIIQRSDGRPLRWFDREDSELVDQAGRANPDRHQELLTRGHVTGEQWRAAVEAAPPESLVSQRDAIAECRTELHELQEVCRKSFGDQEAPGLIEIDQLLSEIHGFLDARVKPPPAEAQESGEARAEGKAEGTAAGSVKSRQAALARLREAADYFRRSEPHSPISLLVERAIRWGGMPYEELMRDYVKDGTALSQIWETLGVRPPEK